MKQDTAYRIKAAVTAVFALLAIFYWFKYTPRGAWAFIGYLLVGLIVGCLLGTLLVLPFVKAEEDDKMTIQIKTTA